MERINRNPDLSIIVTIVSGKRSLTECLKALLQQTGSHETEIIVPFDESSKEVGELAVAFPEVVFHFIEDPGIAASPGISAREHRLYDRRRAVGLALARGRIVAMTEDHAVPAADWVGEIFRAHEGPSAVIGGAIENGVDRPLNWALYYCDFGRYGRPFVRREAEYLSDVNISYKRNVLESVRPLWIEAYHETTVHWNLRKRGETLLLDPNIVVHEQRPSISFREAYRERIEWGRVFAETRSAESSAVGRALYAAGAPFLPAILLARVFANMRRQRRTVKQMIGTLPLAFVLLSGWALGEFLGYVAGSAADPEAADSSVTGMNKLSSPS